MKDLNKMYYAQLSEEIFMCNFDAGRVGEGSYIEA